MSNNQGGSYTAQSLGLPIDQQHSAQQPGATQADLVPQPAPQGGPK
jgi:hypothetical protein